MAESNSARFRIFINARIEDVWREITQSEEPQPCFFNMKMHTNGKQAGEKMQMRTANGKYVGAVGEILEFDPPNRYAHTFRFTNLDDPPCKVIYELEEKDGGVEFTMILDDLTPGTKSAKQMTGGANLILKTLKSVVEKGKVPFGMKMIHIISKLTGPLTPAKCKTANWPL